MSSLSDFGGGNNVEPPHIKPENEVKTSTPDGTKTVGFGGSVPERDTFGFYKAVDKKKHYIRVLDGWAISDDSLALIEKMGATLVFISDTYTGHVWEYNLRDFTEFGEPVPEKILEHPSDTQTYVKADDPVHLWKGHQRDFTLPRDADVEISDHPFKRASMLDE